MTVPMLLSDVPHPRSHDAAGQEPPFVVARLIFPGRNAS